LGIIVFLIILVTAFGSDETSKGKTKGTYFTGGDFFLYGEVNRNLACPYCQTKGMILVKPMKIKSGISGAKAGGGLMTGGISLLITGISSKKSANQAHCKKCSTTWNF